jgi:hypothetical protein
MRCLPPVVAPIANHFAKYVVIVHKKLRNRCSTKLSYVGADFLMILACPERERDGLRNPCSPSEPGS